MRLIKDGRLTFMWLLILTGLPVWSAQPESPDPDPQPEIREREIYVPYQEFLKIVAKNPQATVMTLEEYRNLVLLATANRLKKEPELPPVRGVLAEVVYEGQAGESSVRIDAKYKVSVSGDAWVTCDLGQLPVAPGRMTLDDQPAWLVRHGGRSYLLLRGAGLHTGDLSFTVPLQRDEDVLKLQTPLPCAAAGVVRLNVPGRAEGEANVPLGTRYDEGSERTFFEAGLGRSEVLTLSWKARHEVERNQALLLVRQQVAYDLQPALPRFVWKANVRIARRKTDRLSFRLSGNLNIERLTGPGVHAWHVENGVLQIVLDQPIQGDLELDGFGLVSRNAGSLVLSAPSLEGAAQDTRHLSLREPDQTRLKVAGTRDVRELAPGDANVAGGQLSGRVFLATGANPEISVSVTDWPLVFDTRAALDVVIDSRETLLTAAWQVNIERGRLYTARLIVPAPWQLLQITETGTGRGLSAERISEQNGEVWLLKLEQAAGERQPLAFSAQLRAKQAEDALAEWETRALTLATPRVEGARRASAKLAFRVAPAIDVTFRAMPDWRSEDPGRLEATGLDREFLRAGLTTETPGAELNVTLTRRASRGMYEAVTHLLTFEQKAWVRCDIRLSVLDRDLEEMVLDLPEGVPETVHVLGPGIKEVAPGGTLTQRRVRFEQPWLGVRIFRIEYRTDIEAGKDLAVPVISLRGGFDARRRIVFQSAGAVALTPPQPGSGLAQATLDETPEFAQPFREGRALYAYVLRADSTKATYRTAIFEQSKVLSSAVGVMEMVTVLDGSGVSRTHVAFEYHYARDQYLKIALPPDANLLAVSVQDRNVQPVQDAAPGVYAIPLPPLTVVRVELAYERRLSAWSVFGSWSETGPDLLGIPVGETRWRLFHAPGWDCMVNGGNLQAEREVVPAYFCETFWGRLTKGFHFTAWEEPRYQQTVSEYVTRVRSTQQEAPNASAQQALQAIEVKQQDAEALRAFGALALPEGLLVEASKLGGMPEYVLSFQKWSYAQFAKRFSFLLAVLIALFLAVRRSRKAVVTFIVVGLLAGTLIPPAIGWSSPLLVVPFCEGLIVAALFALARGVVMLLGAVCRRGRRNEALAAVLLLVVLPGGVVSAEECPTVIPYPPDRVTQPDADPEWRKVYLPRERFLELMRYAHPEKDEIPDLPRLPGGEMGKRQEKGSKAALQQEERYVRLAVGNGHYEVTITDKTWEARGAVDVRTFDPEEWVKLVLPFDPLHLVSVTLDDQPAVIAYDQTMAGSKASARSVPYIPVKGAGVHRMAVTLRGPLELSPGRARLHTRLMGGAGARLALRLPTDVELDQKDRAIWIRKEADAQVCEMDLGLGGEVALSWRAPDIRAPQTVQIASRSLSLLNLESDGYRVTRVDRVTVEGPGVEVLSYRIAGDWEIVKVAAGDLAEWAVSEEGAERRLRLWFRKAVNNVQINLEGWAPLGAEAREVAGLALENAVRQAGFISLEHGGGRRFAADSLKELNRTSWAQAQRELGITTEATADRLYQFHEPRSGLRVAAEWEQGKTSLETRAIGVIGLDRLTACVQTRYVAGEAMPWRHEVELPDDWKVLTVRGNLLRDWEIVDVGGRRRMVLYFTGHATQGTEVVWTAEHPLALPALGALNLNLPLPRTLGVQQESIDWIVAADAALSVREGAGSDLRPLPLARAATWIRLDGADEYRMAFRSLKGEGRLNVDVTRMESLARAEVVSFVRPESDHVQVNAHVKFEMEQAGLERFELLLPTGATLTGLSARNLKERQLVEAADGLHLTVILQSPERGVETIRLAYRLPREPEQDVAVAGPVVVGNAVKRQTHYLGLIRVPQGPFVVADPKGLTQKVKPEELPAVPDQVSEGALSDAYVAEAGWRFTVRQPDVEVRNLPDAEISLAELLTVLSADGDVRSVATYTVRNRARQFLRIALPPEAMLWGVLVDGKPATVSQEQVSGQRVLGVPIQRLTEAELPLKVAVYYTEQRLDLPALARGFAPLAPEVLETNIVKTLWQVYVPEDYRATVTGGNMEGVVESLLYGERVKTNVDEVNRLLLMNRKPESPSQRRKVLSSLQRQQQELSDNYVQLDNSLNTSNSVDVQRLGNDVYEGQNKQGMRYRADAQNVRDQLVKDLPEQMEQAEAELAAEERRQVLDAYNFLGNGWRAGREYKAKAAEEREQNGDVPLDRLTNARSFGGFGQADLPRPDVTAPDAQPQRLRPEVAWKTDGDRGMLTVQAGAELRVPTRGTSYTFQCVEGRPELELMLRSQPASWRWGARAAVVLLLAVGFFLRRRWIGN